MTSSRPLCIVNRNYVCAMSQVHDENGYTPIIVDRSSHCSVRLTCNTPSAHTDQSFDEIIKRLNAIFVFSLPISFVVYRRYVLTISDALWQKLCNIFFVAVYRIVSHTRISFSECHSNVPHEKHNALHSSYYISFNPWALVGPCYLHSDIMCAHTFSICSRANAESSLTWLLLGRSLLLPFNFFPAQPWQFFGHHNSPCVSITCGRQKWKTEGG